MLVNAFGLCTLLATAFAYAVPRAGFLRRDGDPSDADLLASCPGGPGSSVLKRADRCTLVNATANPDIRFWKPLGDPQLNCGGGTDPVTVTLGGETDVTQTVEASANLGVDVDGISIGGGLTTSKSTTTTTSKQVSFQIEPGKQAVYAAGIAMHSTTGTIQVNYGSRQDGHFIWFVFDVTQRVPIDPEDIQFDVYQSDCGTNPNDLSSLNTAV